MMSKLRGPNRIIPIMIIRLIGGKSIIYIPIRPCKSTHEQDEIIPDIIPNEKKPIEEDELFEEELQPDLETRNWNE